MTLSMENTLVKNLSKTIGNPHKNIYDVRDMGGRTGNVLFEYFFWRLLAMNNRKTFRNNLNVNDYGLVSYNPDTDKCSFPEPFHIVDNLILKENQDIFELLPAVRAKAIKDFLKIRLRYLKKVMEE